MLQLLSVRKSYTTGSFTQTALDDVSIAFRDNEFVAILGPSGSGKTTLLNIVGGLDHYDSGDVIIDGVSTREYRDRDWDAYRNNRIGFVFQSYNLIPHQSVLANVELALTLAGVSRAARRAKAMAALTDVGLAEHAHKLPNQLSGGQMQRVAIARALINDPEILLADEPTGALDSTTSVHVMDLLTQIARDRLVIMVTHNPDLAAQYATRTVALSDGAVVQDTDPYWPAEVPDEGDGLRRTAMSFLTAIGLSFTNLMTKKGRTLMTAFAGSIGIVGIAAILALANGVGLYIKDIEEETLSMYPLSIQAQGIDMTALLTGGGGDDSEPAGDDDPGGGPVREVPMLNRVFSGVNTNDLTSLKRYLDFGGGGIDEYTNAIEYSYDVTPQIYRRDVSDGVRQVNPDTTFNSIGFGASPDAGGPFASQLGGDSFEELMDDLSLVEEQYDVVAGDWPQGPDELVVVLSSRGGIGDYALYTLGLRDAAELDRMVQQLRDGEELTEPAPAGTYDYDEILGVTFSLVHAADYYTYDDAYDIWTDRRSDPAYLRGLVEEGEELRVAGIVKPKEDASATALNPGIYYDPSLTHHVMEVAADSTIVKDQLGERSRNVFTGKSFGDDDPEIQDFDLSSLVTIDESAIAGAFSVDESMLTIDPSGFDLAMPDIALDPSLMPALDLSSLAGSLDLSDVLVLPEPAPAEPQPSPSPSPIPDVDPDEAAAALGGLMTAYADYVEAQGLDPAQFADNFNQFVASEEGSAALVAVEDLDMVQGYLDFSVGDGLDPLDVTGNLQPFLDSLAPAPQQVVPDTATTRFAEDYLRFADDYSLDPLNVADNLPLFLGSPEGQSALADTGIRLDFAPVERQLQAAITDYMGQVMAVYTEQLSGQVADALQAQVGAAMESTMSQLAATLPSAMRVDEAALQEAFQFNLDPQELTQLLVAMSAAEQNSYERNLRTLGYADPDSPSRIDLYPVDFEGKEHITDLLNAYNEDQRASGNDDRVITWTDIVGALMSSVTDIINMISYVLIAFVAISLVVSSIMIGIITYVSVLERRKEIGILRAVGASKGDIARVFNAETLIVGFVAGVMGILITLLLTIPANAIVESRFDVANVAVLPWQAAVILVFISMGLSFLAGLIPSSAASRKDPVEALRSE
ncbi:ABC transporter ATP-binding protein/permease [Tessaracoccus oleiagri]|uniref:ABC-type lipoprotein export system, ATPase component n=1 Tax=Tessaracoccus oleiagri TaxID=686624 RepID=A0A1G9HMQ6_9ACTN|nr:ABC transporter ATP-binding protein/permease [Tessaracoccus oleiagri]SDL14220.1 ABC-type lipoprotein export system, ATPase component [Tessaracoccus oleiagri]